MTADELLRKAQAFPIEMNIESTADRLEHLHSGGSDRMNLKPGIK